MSAYRATAMLAARAAAKDAAAQIEEPVLGIPVEWDASRGSWAPRATWDGRAAEEAAGAAGAAGPTGRRVGSRPGGGGGGVDGARAGLSGAAAGCSPADPLRGAGHWRAGGGASGDGPSADGPTARREMPLAPATPFGRTAAPDDDVARTLSCEAARGDAAAIRPAAPWEAPRRDPRPPPRGPLSGSSSRPRPLPSSSSSPALDAPVQRPLTPPFAPQASSHSSTYPSGAARAPPLARPDASLPPSRRVPVGPLSSPTRGGETAAESARAAPPRVDGGSGPAEAAGLAHRALPAPAAELERRKASRISRGLAALGIGRKKDKSTRDHPSTPALPVDPVLRGAGRGGELSATPSSTDPRQKPPPVSRPDWGQPGCLAPSPRAHRDSIGDLCGRRARQPDGSLPSSLSSSRSSSMALPAGIAGGAWAAATPAAAAVRAPGELAEADASSPDRRLAGGGDRLPVDGPRSRPGPSPPARPPHAPAPVPAPFVAPSGCTQPPSPAHLPPALVASRKGSLFEAPSPWVPHPSPGAKGAAQRSAEPGVWDVEAPTAPSPAAIAARPSAPPSLAQTATRSLPMTPFDGPADRSEGAPAVRDSPLRAAAMRRSASGSPDRDRMVDRDPHAAVSAVPAPAQGPAAHFAAGQALPLPPSSAMPAPGAQGREQRRLPARADVEVPARRRSSAACSEDYEAGFEDGYGAGFESGCGVAVRGLRGDGQATERDDGREDAAELRPWADRDASPPRPACVASQATSVGPFRQSPADCRRSSSGCGSPMPSSSRDETPGDRPGDARVDAGYAHARLREPFAAGARAEASWSTNERVKPTKRCDPETLVSGPARVSPPPRLYEAEISLRGVRMERLVDRRAQPPEPTPHRHAEAARHPQPPEMYRGFCHAPPLQHEAGYQFASASERHPADGQVFAAAVQQPLEATHQAFAAPCPQRSTTAYHSHREQVRQHRLEAEWASECVRPLSGLSERPPPARLQSPPPPPVVPPRQQPAPAPAAPHYGFWGRTRLPSDEELLSRLSEAAAAYASPGTSRPEAVQAPPPASYVCHSCGRSQGCYCGAGMHGAEPTAPCMPPEGFQ